MAGLADALRGWQKGIPCPWADLSRVVTVRPGGLTLVTGAPGALKSMLSLNWALALDAPSIYLSLDTAMTLQGARIISRMGNEETHHIYFDLDNDEKRGKWVEWLAEFERQSKMKMFDIPVSPQEVGEMARAWGDYWGEPPAVIIVDDVDKLKGVKDYPDFSEMLVTLGNVAKEMNNVVFGIHHVNRAGGSATQRPKLRDLKFAGDYDASYVLGLWRPHPARLRVSVLKNRTGLDDPNGNLYAELGVDATKAYIRDLDPLERQPRAPAVQYKEEEDASSD